MTDLEIAGIEKAFGAVSVLRGVHMNVKSRQVHALLGENGAGKSTLMRIVLGIEQADGGTMKLGGKLYAPRHPGEARTSGVVMLPQERTLCAHLTVAENVVLGLEPHAHGFLRAKDARAIAERALELVTGAPSRIPLDVRAGELGVADQQLVEIGRALAQGGVASDSKERTEARVLILDEPTSSLGHDDAARLFDRIHALKDGGLAIVLVTHFLGDVRAHADRYTVLRDGKVQGEGDPKHTQPSLIVQQMLGRELEASREDHRADEQRDQEHKRSADVLLRVKGIGGAKRPRSVSFELLRGEVLGIAGLVGSGRTELLRVIMGLDSANQGEIRLHAEKGMGLLSEDRGGEGLMLGRSIADNVALSAHGPLVTMPSDVLAEGARWMAELAVKGKGPAQRVGELSGGNQQKVQIARLLREDYDVLLIDEPTRGIDVASKAQVLSLIRELAQKGKGIVLVSSQLDELVTTCDRIGVLRRGELEAPRPAAEWTEEKLLLEASS